MTDSASEVLLRQDKDGITRLILNRGSQYNALSDGLLDILTAMLNDIAEDRSVRVVIISGAGKVFSAGHDLKEMRTKQDKDALHDLFHRCAVMMQAITNMPQPVIAEVHGIATAAGCQLVAQCDLAVAADTTRFATSGINLGLFCSTPMVAVTRNMPRKQAMELLMTGDFIDAATAEKYGLINKAVPEDRLQQASEELAQKIASKSPSSIAFGKKLFYAQIEEGMEAAYRMAADTMTCNMMTEDAEDGIDAFISKQPMPQWKGK